MFQSSAPNVLTPQMHVAETDDELEKTVRLTAEILEDLRLADQILRALHATGYRALRNIKVSVVARIVRLVGRVPSYHLKQVAQATALAIPGADQIHNVLEVAPTN
jgi:osmotically-inducible protein OsmY